MNAQSTLVNVETYSIISSFKTTFTKIITCVISLVVNTLKTFLTIMAAEATLVSISARPIDVFVKAIFATALETIFCLLTCHRVIAYAVFTIVTW